MKSETERQPLFEVFLGSDDHWYWHLVGANGEIMAQSEGYASKSNAKRAVKRFVKLVQTAEILKQDD